MRYIIIVGIIIGVICVAIKLISDHREWKKYEEEFRQKKINEEKSRLRGNIDALESIFTLNQKLVQDNENKVYMYFMGNDLKDENAFISSEKNYYNNIKKNYDHVYGGLINSTNGIESSISSMQPIVSSMQSANNELVRRSYDKMDEIKAAITKGEKIVKQDMPKLVNRLKNITELFGLYKENVEHCFSICKMMDENNYGRIDNYYWNAMQKKNRESYIDYIIRCEGYLNDSSSIEDICKINPEIIIDCIWLFAIEQTVSMSDLNRAETLFKRIAKKIPVDIIIADLYVKKKVGGERVIRDTINSMLKSNVYTVKELKIVASGLMWMNAYGLETDVLQYMLTNGMEMDAKVQQRLHSLTNGGGNAPEGLNVRSSNDIIYFDLSSLAWKESEYIGLFENLSFQEKVLTYSLAIREETKDLLIPQGINASDLIYILDRFNIQSAKEYGSEVRASIINCKAISGNGAEQINGIVVISNACKQMGILVYIAKIGNRLNIKFYTLYIPNSVDLPVQKQQVLSMHNKVSPSVSMWEDSLKNSMLRVIEQILNLDSSMNSNLEDKEDNIIF